MKSVFWSVLLFCSAISVGAAQSAQVVLSAPQSGYAVKGVLLGMNAKYFVVDTALGAISVARSFANCQGDACPENDPRMPSYLVSPSEVADDRTPDVLLEGHTSRLRGSFAQRAAVGAYQLHLGAISVATEATAEDVVSTEVPFVIKLKMD